MRATRKIPKGQRKRRGETLEHASLSAVIQVTALGLFRMGERMGAPYGELCFRRRLGNAALAHAGKPRVLWQAICG